MDPNYIKFSIRNGCGGLEKFIFLSRYFFHKLCHVSTIQHENSIHFFETTQDFQAESLISIKRLLNFHKHGSFFGYASQPAPDCNRLIIKT